MEGGARFLVNNQSSAAVPGDRTIRARMQELVSLSESENAAAVLAANSVGLPY